MCVTAAGEIRLLASQRLMSEVRNTARMKPISISDVTDVLRTQLTVAECDVFAYASIESDVVVLVMPITVFPTPLQVLHLIVDHPRSDHLSYFVTMQTDDLFSRSYFNSSIHVDKYFP